MNHPNHQNQSGASVSTRIADRTISAESAIEIQVNEQALQVEVGISVAELLVQLQLDRGPVAVERNQQLGSVG